MAGPPPVGETENDEKGLGLPGGCIPIPDVEPVCSLKAGRPSLKILMGGPARSRTRRILLGNPPVVGVAGRTLTEWCGLLACMGVFDTDVETEPLDDVELALLWL
jgi:hypothetical protein